MKQHYTVILSLGFIFCVAISSANSRDVNQPNDLLSLIELDYREGIISLDEKFLNQVYAIKNNPQLSSRYQSRSEELQGHDLRRPTMVFKEIIVAWDQLENKTQNSLKALVGRPSLTDTYDSPAGYFRLHYDVLGPNSVPTADLDVSGVPDFIEKCAAYCDSSWVEHTNLGYFDPPSDGGAGGDSRYDVYFEEMDYYGFAVPEVSGPEAWNDYTSFIEMHRNFIGFPSNTDPEGNWQGAAKATAAHEFRHAVQFGYDVDESSWYMELDATYMEDIVFNAVNDNYNYLSYYFDDPEKSLMEQTIHMYASFVWNMYLAEKFDTSLHLSVWEGARYSTVYNTLSDSLLGNFGWSQDSAFGAFAVWNYITNFRDDNLHYVEGSEYDPMTIDRSHSSFPVALQNSPKSPAGYGVCYVEFIPDGLPGTKKIIFDGSDSREWAAFIIKSTSANSHEYEKIILNSGSWDGYIEVPNFSSYYRVTLVGVNLSEFTSGANYSYEVELVSVYSVLAETISDSALYPGGTRDLEFRITNTSSENDIFSILSGDDSGWVTQETIDKALLSGADAVITVFVEVPQFTTLGSTNQVWVKAVSWGNGDVTDSVSAPVEVVLQRGDANFSGKVNVSDLSYLTAYLFGIPTGPEPVPVFEAGDFNCNGKVNVTDITRLILYLFQNGDWSPCNPY